jgi:hypothetical protein
MAQRNDEVLFEQHGKVVAAHDLPGIAAGTPGKVLLINGLSWVRYRVLFEGRIERGMLSAGDLTTPEAWAAQQRQIQTAEREAEREARRAAATSGAVGTSDTEGSAA